MQDARIGVFQSHGEFERHRAARTYFWAVIRAYLDVLDTPPLAAISYDEEFPNRRLGAETIHYKVDVERTSLLALGNNPTLFAAWNKLIRGEDVPNANDIINRCGKRFQQLHLAPWIYFVTVKQGRKRCQNVSAALPGCAA